MKKGNTTFTYNLPTSSIVKQNHAVVVKQGEWVTDPDEQVVLNLAIGPVISYRQLFV
jgi:hypothetical protein